MRKSTTIRALVLQSGLWMALLGGLTRPGAALAQVEMPGAISGTVFEFTLQGPQPVSGAEVRVLGEGPDARRSAMTGADGRYSVTDLPPGTYRVEALKPFPDAAYVNSYFRLGGSTLLFRDATPVSLSPGQQLTGVDLRLFRRLEFAGSIDGTVRRASDGATVAGGQVVALAAYSDFAASAVVGLGGRYQLNRLPPGNYFVTALVPGYARQVYPQGYFHEDGAVVTVPDPLPGGAVGEIDFALQPGGSISGSVRREAGGLAVPGANVAALDERGRILAAQLAGADQAAYRLDHLPLGTYRVAASAPQRLAENLSFEFYQDAQSFEAALPIALDLATPDASGVDLTLPDGGVLQGLVTDGQGQPLAGAFVTAQPEHNPLGLHASALTGADGTYRIEKLASGRYIVQAGAAGKIREFYDNALGRDFATPVSVTAGATLGGIDFQLETGRTLTGIVRLGASGVDGVRLVLHSESLRFTREGRSGPGGGFRLDGLPPAGDYRLVALAQDTAPGQVFPVDLRNADQNVEVILETGRRLGGIVVSSGGSALVGAVVELSHPKIPRPLSIFTDRDGRFFFQHQPSSGGDRLAGRAAGRPRTVLEGLSLEAGDRLDVVLTLGPGRSISGKVTRSGAPLEGVRVTAHSPSSQSTGSARTLADGSYRIEGLAVAADYTVVAGRDALQVVPYPAKVSLVASDATGIDIDIPAGRSLSGTVTVAGSPVAGVRLMAWSPSARRGGLARTGIQGTYTIADLPPAADYRLLALQPGFAPQFYAGAAAPEDATLIDLTAASVPGLDFALVAGFSLSGNVRSADGQPVQGAFVTVESGSGGIVGSARTDGTGAFETTAVGPGTYTLRARAQGQPGTAEIAAVVIDSTSIGGLLLTFAPGGAIEGTVGLAGGGDPNEALVLVFRKSDRSFVQMATVQPGGMYRFGALPAGEYLIAARAEGYLSRAYAEPEDAASLATATAVPLSAGGTVAGIDITLPSAPAAKKGSVQIQLAGAALVFSSYSATPGVWTSSSKVTIGWKPVQTARGDETVASGYNAVFDTSETTDVPPETPLGPEVTSATSEVLPDGIYYAHVRYTVVELDPATGLPTAASSEVADAGPFLLDTTPPPSPSQLAATTDSGQIALSWLNPLSDPGGSGLDAVQVQRDGTEFPGAPSEGQLVYQNEQPQIGQQDGFNDTAVTDGVPYYYAVFAVDSAGNISVPGAQHSGAPAPLGEDARAPVAPADLQVATAETQVTLTWQNPPDKDLQGIEIRHSTQGYPQKGQGQLVADLRGVRPNEQMTFVHAHPGLGPHYYSVFAYDAVPNYSESAARGFAFMAGTVGALGGRGVLLGVLGLLGAAFLQRRRGRNR